MTTIQSGHLIHGVKGKVGIVNCGGGLGEGATNMTATASSYWVERGGDRI